MPNFRFTTFFYDGFINHDLKSIGQILFLFSFLFLLPSSLWSHAADERSHQVITFMPDSSGANLLFELYCGPKLGRTLIMAIDMAKKQPDILEDEFNPTLLALLEKRPWLDVKCSSISQPLDSSSDPKPTPSQIHFKAFKQLTQDPISRHQLFRDNNTNQTLKYEWLDLKLLPPGRELGEWLPNQGTKNTPKQGLLHLSFNYRLTWPSHLPLSEGITLTVDTSLKVFTSNTVFLWKAKPNIELTPDHLLINQAQLDPKDFLNHLPSSRFKLRRAIFFCSSDKSNSKTKP